jgi:diketogulonate reductase-like aldo/keto reductase
MKTRTLTADIEIPYLGFGTYLIANGEVAAAVYEAIRAGYRHIEELKVAALPIPVANQIELHPWSQKPDLVRYLDDSAITPIAYAAWFHSPPGEPVRGRTARRRTK